MAAADRYYDDQDRGTTNFRKMSHIIYCIDQFVVLVFVGMTFSSRPRLTLGTSISSPSHTPNTGRLFNRLRSIVSRVSRNEALEEKRSPTSTAQKVNCLTESIGYGAVRRALRGRDRDEIGPGEVLPPGRGPYDFRRRYPEDGSHSTRQGRRQSKSARVEPMRRIGYAHCCQCH